MFRSFTEPALILGSRLTDTCAEELDCGTVKRVFDTVIANDFGLTFGYKRTEIAFMRGGYSPSSCPPSSSQSRFVL